MSADCWACSQGLAPSGKPSTPSAVLGAALGTCFQCYVFGCPFHAERDRLAGKWRCYPSVADALSVSAHLDAESGRLPTEMRFRSTSDFESRLPYIADATSELREHYRRIEQVGTMAQGMKEADAEVDVELVGDAMGVLGILIPSRDHLLAASIDVRALVGDRLATIFIELVDA